MHRLFQQYMLKEKGSLNEALGRISRRLSACGDFRNLSMPDGKIYPYATPLLTSIEERERLIQAGTTLAQAFERLAETLKKDSALADSLGLFGDPLIRELFLPEQYPLNIPVFRLDLFLEDGGPRLLEINTGCPGGELDAGLLGSLFMESPWMMEFAKEMAAVLDHSDPREDCLQRILECYREFRKRGHEDLPEKPTIALVTTTAQAPLLLPECRGIAEYHRLRGYESLVGDLLDLEASGDGIYLMGRRVHLLFRKFSTISFMKRLTDRERYGEAACNKVRRILEVYMQGGFCMVNPLASTVMQDKGLLSVIGDLEPGLHAMIPETHILDKALRQREPGLYRRIKQGREFILKKRASFGGRWVILSEGEISARLERIIEEEPGRWIAQRRLKPPEAHFEIVDGEDIRGGIHPYMLSSFGRSFYIRVATGGGGSVPINAEQGSAAAALIAACRPS